MPCHGVIKTVVAPEQLTARNKGWGPKDVQMPRLAGVVIIGESNGFRVCCRDHKIGVLADLAQTF